MTRGLVGVVAGDTKIATTALGSGLTYRGYSIDDLSQNCCFQEVAYLLLVGKLPNQDDLSSFKAKIAERRTLPPELLQQIKLLPKQTPPINVLLLATVGLCALEPQSKTNTQFKIALRLLAIFGPVLLFWHHYCNGGKEIQTQTDPTDSIATNFMKLLQRKQYPDPIQVRALDVYLILFAEHEFNPSTFSARVAASTLSDFYSCVVSAIGALKGTLHGGAQESALLFLSKMDSLEKAKAELELSWRKKQKVIGFGHRIYKKEDPRVAILKRHSGALLKTQEGSMRLMEVAQYVQKRMVDEKGIYPNADFYSAVALTQCGVPASLLTSVFAMARVVGWAAHIVEQRENNKLIRPMSNYQGPGNHKFVKMELRAKL